MDTSFIRNFCIIAHIDHGKSTLADRMIEITGSISKREMKDQILDNMDLERERGITIKAQTVSLIYNSKKNKKYEFNLIDTPGHVDFSYEVSRSLAACEGALLVVDATQGVQAQTVANVELAIKHDLDIIVVINKVDLPGANIDKVKKEIEEQLLIETDKAIPISAKTGFGVEDVLEAITFMISAPSFNKNKLKALVFDSWFDSYLGAMSMIRVKSGQLSLGDKIVMMSNKKVFEILQIGKFTPKPVKFKTLSSGEVGFISGSMKSIRDILVGDTLTLFDNPAKKALGSFIKIKQMVYAGIFPIDAKDYQQLKDSLSKLQLNDASLTFEPENSNALGLGFRVGFLGLLHMDIIQERLEREYKLFLVFTTPTVTYHVIKKNGQKIIIDSPSKLPDMSQIESILEPYVKINIYTPQEYIGSIIKLLIERRGIQINIEYLSNRVKIVYEIPMSEIIFDFHDRLKSLSRGYCSMDYELIGYRQGDLIQMNILVNGSKIDALSTIIDKTKSSYKGRLICKKLKEILPKQIFAIAIQAAIGSKIIARESISAFRKDVTAKCYGGDISRKRKLLEKQKEGKKRMKRIGKIDIPQNAFLSILKLND